jgi:hypothetical protein
MNDIDVPDMPDRLEIKITVDDYAKRRRAPVKEAG